MRQDLLDQMSLISKWKLFYVTFLHLFDIALCLVIILGNPWPTLSMESSNWSPLLALGSLAWHLGGTLITFSQMPLHTIVLIVQMVHALRAAWFCVGINLQSDDFRITFVLVWNFFYLVNTFYQ